MKSISLACGVALAAAVLAQSAAPAVQPLAAHQEPRSIGNLVAPGDRVEIVYSVDTSHVRSPKGTLYVRNDLQRRFTALPLKLDGKTTLQARVPARLIRGHKLLYYAVLREPRTGRSVTIPARGAAAAQSAFVLGRRSSSGSARIVSTNCGRPTRSSHVRARPTSGSRTTRSITSARRRSSSVGTARSCFTTGSSNGFSSGSRVGRTSSSAPFRCRSSRATTMSPWGGTGRSTLSAPWARD